MAVKRISNNNIGTPKIRFFNFILLTTILFIVVYQESFLSELNTSRSFHFKSNEIPRAPKTHQDDAAKLPELGIFHSNNSTQRFHGRVLEFLGHSNCSLHFFMTWLTPSKLFGRRELWALDSLFKAHSKACLVIASASLDSVRGYRILKPFLDRGFRILAAEPDLPFLVKNTSAEAWLEEMKTGTKDPGSIPLSQNLSNLMRLVMLYKYGGIYLDTDVVVLRDFTGLRNTVGAQSVDAISKEWTRLNGAVMVFDINHPLLADFLDEFALTFDGSRWGHNGPYLVSRVVERVIREERRTRTSSASTSYNFTVLPPQAFYPVTWHKIERIMKKPANETEKRWVERTVSQLNDVGTYVLHLWRRQTMDSVIEEGSVVARLVSDHCLICHNIS
ncbi:Alpha 1,4-glycosyltransferase domain containing protein [Parasponia andersonii]|uniref:Alpha 1,4-glycosyltransferase domain containing protein n=1 Tax=Parasponia andersonii TaxID=3476 RepID=A0A2P5B445_PARAD|nr:Alpha 1,4-glycosyltransferase domain containing protein [Parasponia andersonii]